MKNLLACCTALAAAEQAVAVTLSWECIGRPAETLAVQPLRARIEANLDTPSLSMTLHDDAGYHERFEFTGGILRFTSEAGGYQSVEYRKVGASFAVDRFQLGFVPREEESDHPFKALFEYDTAVFREEFECFRPDCGDHLFSAGVLAAPLDTPAKIRRARMSDSICRKLPESTHVGP